MIKLEHVYKSFNQQDVINDFSYQFNDGGLYLIKGKSGSGKTTLLNLILSSVQPDKGTVTTKDNFSVLFQQYRLLEKYDIYTNIKAITKTDNKTIYQLGKEILDEECFNKPICELSGGQKQRVCILRALMAESDCIVMDEPFNGLDEKMIETVTQFILKERKNRTLIISTHQYGSLEELGFETIEIS